MTSCLRDLSALSFAWRLLTLKDTRSKNAAKDPDPGISGSTGRTGLG